MKEFIKKRWLKEFIKKRWLDVFLGIFLLLMIIPQTRMPIQVFIQRLIAFSPKEVEEEKQKQLTDYHLTFEDKSNRQFTLQDDKGKVVIINFWATWCPPCVAEMPEFSELYKDYKDRVSFYFITQDEWKLIHKFEGKRAYGLPYYRLIQPSKDLDYTSLPTTYVIDQKGDIIVNKVGVADWNSNKFRALLDKTLKE